jgi:hypothetical protein
MLCPLRLSLATFLFFAAAHAQPSLAGPRLYPRGAQAAGIQRVQFDPGQNAYRFALLDLAGQPQVEYRLPLSHPHVQRGVLRIEETTTGAVPIDAGGLFYTTGNPPAWGLARLVTPFDLAFSAQHDPNHQGNVRSHQLDAVTGTVTLAIEDIYTTASGPVRTEKTYQLRLYGRSLEIRATADETVRSLAVYNYAGFHFGAGSGLVNPVRALHVPYMDMVPVFGGGDGVFVTRFLDWYSSNASETPSTKPATGSGTFSGETSSGYYRNDQNELNAPIREVAYLTVSRDIDDTFPVIDRPASPYRLLGLGHVQLLIPVRGLKRLDAYHLRRLRNVPIALDRFERAADGLLRRFVRDQYDGRWGAGLEPRIDADLGPFRATLHDAFERDAAFPHAPGDARHRTGTIENREANVIGALMLPEPGAFVGRQRGRRYEEGKRPTAPAGNVDDVAHHGGRRRIRARAGADQEQVADKIAVNRHAVGHA